MPFILVIYNFFIFIRQLFHQVSFIITYTHKTTRTKTQTHPIFPFFSQPCLQLVQTQPFPLIAGLSLVRSSVRLVRSSTLPASHWSASQPFLPLIGQPLNPSSSRLVRSSTLPLSYWRIFLAGAIGLRRGRLGKGGGAAGDGFWSNEDRRKRER